MNKQLVPRCRYAVNPITQQPLYCDVYLLMSTSGRPLVHENLFLCDIARSEAKNTVRAYASDLLSFAKMAQPLGGWPYIRASHMTGYLHGELFQNRGYAMATMIRHIETLKRFYGWLAKKGYLTDDREFEWSYRHLYNPKVKENTAHISSQHSFHSLYVDETTFETILSGVNSKNPFIASRDEIVLRLGYESGLRAHEVFDLSANDVQKKINEAKDCNNGLWATTRILVLGKGAKRREVFIPPSLCESIVRYLKRFRNNMNGGKGPLICSLKGLALKDSKYASSVFSKACRNAKIVRHHLQGYHRLRKSYGTHLVDECWREGRDPWVEVPRRLGHSNIETTKKYIQFEALKHGRSMIMKEMAMSDKKYRGISFEK